MLPAKLARVAEEAKLSRLLFGKSSDILDNVDIVKDEIDEEDEKPRRKKPEIKPAWVDDDDDINIGSALVQQGRKIPNGGVNSHDTSYSSLLQRKYTELVGTPAWASLDKDSDHDSEDEILQTIGHIRKPTKHSLKSGLLEFKRLKHLNTNTGKEGTYIEVIQFHPKSRVALVAGNAGIASLLTVDGRENEKLHCISFKNFPIHCGRFYPDGSIALLGSRFPYYYVYDLMKATAVRVPLPNRITKMIKFEVSTCGKYFVIVGRFGEVHLFCAKSRELIQTLKLSGEVTALAFSHDNSKLYGHSKEGNVTVWDLSTLRVIHKWSDDGCVAGSSIAVSPSGDYVATGSDQGVVNIYDTTDILESKQPKPKKIFLNLRTKITGLKFNPHSEILAFSSSYMPNAVRLAHLPSFEVFSNFPNPLADLGHISTVNFSPNGGFMSMGNNKKQAYLLRIKHYKSY